MDPVFLGLALAVVVGVLVLLVRKPRRHGRRHHKHHP